MFKLIKLGVYALLGYILYELYQGISLEAKSMRRRLAGQRGRGSEMESGSDIGSRMTGPGKGHPETTEEFSGTSSPHRVGRGAGI